MRLNFTDRAVASLKAADTRQTEHFDAKVTGLALRISSTGARSWFFHFTDTGGRRVRAKLGSYPSMSLALARSTALEARAQLEAGDDPRAHKAATAAMTVATLVESYLAKRVRPGLRSAYQVERRLHKNVVPIIGDVRLADLHRRDINRVVDEVIARDRLAEANSVYADLRTMLRWALKRGDLDHDPTAGMGLPCAPRRRDRALSETEIAKLWAALPTAFGVSLDCQRILQLCLITGQRVGEIAGMTRTELDLPAREWRLPASRTKNKHAHTVPLSGMALRVINDALADAGDSRPNLFTLPAREVPRLVAQAQDTIGLDQWVPHDLRRTALTRMAALGVEPVVLGYVANHIGTTKAGVTLGVYVKHTYTNETRRALDLWADRLAAIVTGKPAKVIPLGGSR
jgi:integrase